jgi:hypothetical protein
MSLVGIDVREFAILLLLKHACKFYDPYAYTIGERKRLKAFFVLDRSAYK